MPCSAVTLSIATISAIIATALLAIAFSTDNWINYEVKRNSIQALAIKHAASGSLLTNLNSKYYYYSRTRGLFRICFPKERPPISAVPTYLSPLETHCSNIDYFPSNEDDKILNDDATSRLHIARSCVALFVLSFVPIFCAFWTGLSGCWKRSSGAITATSILLLATCLLAAAAMGLWHTMEFFEKEKVVGEDFYQQWNTMLSAFVLHIILRCSKIMRWIEKREIYRCMLSEGAQEHTNKDFKTYRSHYARRKSRTANLSDNFHKFMDMSESRITWIRASIEILKDNTKLSYDWSYIVAWLGVGSCLLAAILLSAAAICLKSEREKEEHLNLQYLMPVYSQKQPNYAPYANYPQPQIYHGPYYHGSQYGPYNF